MDKSDLIKSLQYALFKFSAKIAIRAKRDKEWETITYSQLKEKISRINYFLKTEEFDKGDKIAILLENRPEWAFIFFACISSGIIIVPLDIHSTANEIENIIKDSNAKLIFTSEDIALSNRALRDISSLSRLIFINEIPQEERATAHPEPELPTSEDLAVILYTSGTTASPKGVMLTHNNLYSDFSSLCKLNIISSKDTVLSILPLYHSYSLMVTLITPILSGAQISYPPENWPDMLAKYIKETNATILVGVPQIFHMLHQRIKNKLQDLGLLPKLAIYLCINLLWFVRRRFNLNMSKILLFKLHTIFGLKMRFFVSGGAKLNEDVERDFFSWGFTILEGYGLTETSPVVTFNPPQRPKIGSVGKAIPDVKIQIAGKGEDGIGEVTIQGPNVMKGYYHKDEMTKECLREGWFFSGDLGYIDKEGYLYLTGRSKELIVLSSGKNIYPEEVEAAYGDTPLVKELCVVGVSTTPESKTQDYLYAVVVPNFDFLRDRGEMNIYEVIKNRFENISKDLPSHKHIMGFIITKGPLPRTVLGKIKRYEVEKRYLSVVLKRSSGPQEGLLSKEDYSILNSELGRRIVDYLKKRFDITGPITLSSSIEIDLGVDSLGRAELLSAMERTFGISLPQGMVAASIFTVKDLILTIGQVLSQKATSEVTPKTLESLHITEIIKQPLDTEFLKRIELNPGIFDKIFTISIKGLIYLFFKIFYRLKVEGQDHIPKEGPYIICSNHASFYDGFIIEASIPFHSAIRLFFMGFRRYFIIPVVRSLVKKGRILPIDASQIVDAMQAAYFILVNKKALCIFPEGERSFDGKVGSFKKGVGIIGKEIDIKFIPTFIDGSFDVWPRTRQFPKLGSIGVRFGKPLDSQDLIEEGKRLGVKDDVEAIVLILKEKVAALKNDKNLK